MKLTSKPKVTSKPRKSSQSHEGFGMGCLMRANKRTKKNSVKLMRDK